MTNNLDTAGVRDFGTLPIDILLPERPAIIGEFSPSYDAFKAATLSDLEPASSYEYVLALQLVDFNWAILQRKASADVELSLGTESKVKSDLRAALLKEGDRDYSFSLKEFEAAGGDEEDFEHDFDWDGIDARVEKLVSDLKSQDAVRHQQATAEAMALGVDPRIIVSMQLLNNSGYRRHSEKLPDLEKRARLLSSEYREVQKARPIDVVPVSKP